MSTSDHEVNMMRELGRKAAVSLARAPERMGGTQGVAREFARVTKVYSDGRVDVDKGSAAYPMPMLGIRTTTACLAVEVGDTVVVDTYAHVPVATGVMATADNRHYVKAWSGSIVLSVGTGNVETFGVWDHDTVVAKFPGCGDFPHVSFSNGDITNSQAKWVIYGALQVGGPISEGGYIYCQASRSVTGMLRLNYLVVAADGDPD